MALAEIFLLGMLLVLLVGFAQERIAMEVSALGPLVALTRLSSLSANETLAGFSLVISNVATASLLMPTVIAASAKAPRAS